MTDKTKNGDNVPSFKVIEVVLLQCNLVDNQYWQKSEELYSFTPNKSYSYMLNIKPSNLVFLKTFKTELDDTITKFNDKNGKPVQIEDKFNLILVINPKKAEGGQFYPLCGFSKNVSSKEKVKPYFFCYF